MVLVLLLSGRRLVPQLSGRRSAALWLVFGGTSIVPPSCECPHHTCRRPPWPFSCPCSDPNPPHKKRCRPRLASVHP
eukprot:1415168-Prorocentrum_lima.AAC.1